MAQIHTPRRQQAGERRQQILEAALGMFSRKGFEGTSIREIAREVGVTEGLLYHYFPSKDHLLVACWDERSVHPVIEEAIARSQGVPVTEVLREIMRGLLRDLRQNSALVRVLAAEMLHRGDCLKAHMSRSEDMKRVFREFLLSRQRAGEIRAEVDVEIAAMLLMGAAHSYFLMCGNSSEEEWRELSSRFVMDGVDVVAHGLTSATETRRASTAAAAASCAALSDAPRPRAS